MRTLLATVILFGLGTGLALAGDNNLYAYKTMLQVQSGNYSAHIDQNGGEHFVGR